jgi:hypothetical protein
MEALPTLSPLTATRLETLSPPTPGFVFLRYRLYSRTVLYGVIIFNLLLANFFKTISQSSGIKSHFPEQ